ncbi:MAG TPA: S-layer protein, partial [Planctomycetaceae bacterium]|nr:S-layer protein [Planctomycetaceae bacterium]
MAIARLFIRPKTSFCGLQTCVVIGLLWAPYLRASEAEFVVIPPAISLNGPDASARFLVQEVLRKSDSKNLLTTGPAIEQYQVQVADLAIARVEGQQIVAVGNGATELLVRVGRLPRVARVPIVVRDLDRPQRWQFDAHVQSVLTKQGCNGGACHGALAGKGGFRLSLLGYDSSADHFTITAQDHGRRMEPADPMASLLMTKPTMQVPHKGGLKLDANSREYQILVQWIAAGSPGHLPEDAALMKVEVLPDALQLQTSNHQKLIVRAHYEDGRIEDVTQWAKFSSNNEAVIKADSSGEISVL